MAYKKDNTIENRMTQSPTLCQSPKNKSRSAYGIFQPLKQPVTIQPILLREPVKITFFMLLANVSQ